MLDKEMTLLPRLHTFYEYYKLGQVIAISF